MSDIGSAQPDPGKRTSISDAFPAHEILSFVFDRCQEHDIGGCYRAALWRADHICMKALRAALDDQQDDVWAVAAAPRNSAKCKHIAPRVSELGLLMRQDQSGLTPMQIVGETCTQLLAMPSVALDGAACCNSAGIKVFLVLFLQKKNTSSFSEEKEAKRLLFSRGFTIRA